MLEVSFIVEQPHLSSYMASQDDLKPSLSCRLSNSSLLDEATAAAEAMTMCSALARGKKDKFPRLGELTRPQELKQLPLARHMQLVCLSGSNEVAMIGRRAGLRKPNLSPPVSVVCRTSATRRPSLYASLGPMAWV